MDVALNTAAWIVAVTSGDGIFIFDSEQDPTGSRNGDDSSVNPRWIIQPPTGPVVVYFRCTSTELYLCRGRGNSGLRYHSPDTLSSHRQVQLHALNQSYLPTLGELQQRARERPTGISAFVSGSITGFLCAEGTQGPEAVSVLRVRPVLQS